MGKTKEDKPLYLPLVYDIPKYEDPLETTPRVTITTSLAEPATALFRISYIPPRHPQHLSHHPTTI